MGQTVEPTAPRNAETTESDEAAGTDRTRHTVAFFVAGGSLFAGGVGLLSWGLTHHDEGGIGIGTGVALSLASVAPLAVGAVLLVVGIVRWVLVDEELAALERSSGGGVSFDFRRGALVW